MMNRLTKRIAWHRRRAFSLLEASISVVLVSVMLFAALDTVGASKSSQRLLEQRGRAYLLAQELMSEILRQAYADPEDVGLIDLRLGSLVTVAIGVEAGEPRTCRMTPDAWGPYRAGFDDVDDYHGWAASPPQTKDKDDPSAEDCPTIPELAGWMRSVTVEARPLGDIAGLPLELGDPDEGIKLITVTVAWGEGFNKSVSLRAIKGAGLPPAALSGPRVLLIVDDVTALTSHELERLTQLESWGFAVDLIAASSTQEQFDAAFAGVDVVFVPLLGEGSLGLKLRGAPVGVVSEYAALAPDLGLASSVGTTGLLSSINIENTPHYITAEFSPGLLDLVGGLLQSWTDLGGETASGLTTLASGSILLPTKTLTALEEDATLYGGGTAPGRRVQLPWGGSLLGLDLLAADGLTMLRRSIQWAGKKELADVSEGAQ